MHRATPALGDEHELPASEAVLAATLALMTGYSQALQADLHPQQRVLMGAKIGRNLELLADHPALSDGFQRIALGLLARWRLMSHCTCQAEPACDAPPVAACAAPSRLQ
ncbi:MAG: hypothetical protein KF788_14810 [Piscinibacter sp.]|nr:hypothetical protein [Piscinibacter sp.]